MKRITFYIASSLNNQEQVKRVTKELENRGLECTYKWAEHGSLHLESRETIAQAAEAELKGAMFADIFIAMLPGGRGTHTEFGAAIASRKLIPGRRGKKIILWTDDAEEGSDISCSFYNHPEVIRLTCDEARIPGALTRLCLGESPAEHERRDLATGKC